MASSSSFSSIGFPRACDGFSGQYLLRCPCFLPRKHRPSFRSFSRSSSLRGGRVLVARALTRPGVVSIASSPFFVNAFFHWSCVGRVSLFLWNRDLIHKYVVWCSTAPLFHSAKLRGLLNLATVMASELGSPSTNMSMTARSARLYPPRRAS